MSRSPDLNIDRSHVSTHHTEDGKPGTYPISQEITANRGTKAESSVIAYTEITDLGGPNEPIQTRSGFADKV